MASDAQIPTLRLALVGAGPAEGSLRDVFAGVADRVVFTGLLRGDELSEAFASAVSLNLTRIPTPGPDPDHHF